jgi:hypothetical protein
MKNNPTLKDKIKIENSLQDLIIVNKENFHYALNEFRNYLKDEKCKFVFFNIDFSNVNLLSEKIYPGEIDKKEGENHLKDFLIKIQETKNNLEKEKSLTTQLTYSEFLICIEKKKSFKLHAFLIPSMKFHKLKEKESILTFDPESLFNMNFFSQNYSFSQLCKTKTLSYLNFQELDKIKMNFEKILSEGKPTKNENKKSYYFYPKNVLMPTKDTQKNLEQAIQNIITILKDRKQETQSSDTENHHFCVKNDFYSVEKLINFEWRTLLNPYNRELIEVKIDRCEVKNLNIFCTGEEFQLMQFVENFCLQVIDYISIGNYEKDLIIDYPKFLHDENFFINWRNFLEKYFEFKILITLIFENYSVKFNFRQIKTNYLATEEFYIRENIILDDFKTLLRSLHSILSISQTSTPNENNSDRKEILNDGLTFHKNHLLREFNYYSLIPKKLHKHFDISYHLCVHYSLYHLRAVNFEKLEKIDFKYEDFFQNLNNEKEILFDYELEKELYVFLTLIKKEIENQLLDSSKKSISISSEDILKDFYIFLLNEENKKSFEKIFKGFIQRFGVDLKKKEFTFDFAINDKEKLKNDFLLNSDIEKEIRYELIKFFTDLKKEIFICEDFGVSNFFKTLFELNCTNGFSILSCNLLQKLVFVYLEIFNNSDPNEEPIYDEFLQFLHKIKFFDINYLCSKTNFNFVQEMSKIMNPNKLNTVKFFEIINNIFLKGSDTISLLCCANKFYIQSPSNDKILFCNLDGKILFEDKEEKLDDKNNNLRLIVKYLNGPLEKFLLDSVIDTCKEFGEFKV